MSIDGTNTGEKVNWHDSYNVLIRERKGFYNSRLSQGDAFYRLFLSDACLGKACYEKCKFKYDKSSADIRIGDLWGKTYQDDEDGVSAAIAFTNKGNKVLKQCNCTLVEHPFEIVAEGQMKVCPSVNSVYAKINETLMNKDVSINNSIRVLNKEQLKRRMISRLKHPVRTICNIIKKI